MQLIRGLINLQTQLTACVATIGNFDGVHIGHQAIVARVIHQAKLLGVPSCVVLFEPHPKEFFMGDSAPVRLTCFREKYHLLSALGVDKLLVLQFNQSMGQMDAIDFVNNILINKLKIKHLVVGDDFHFGHKRQGNFELLEKMSPNQYTLEPTPTIFVDNARISSTLVRDALANNDLKKTQSLLNRLYSMTGKVGYGQQLGRTISFPTANVAIKRKKTALKGVFLVKCHWQKDKKSFSSWGAANCGSRPTLNANKYRLEVHLMGVSQSLYGIELAVDFYEFIRDEKKFAGLDELKAQIERDINKAQSLILEHERLLK